MCPKACATPCFTCLKTELGRDRGKVNSYPITSITATTNEVSWPEKQARDFFSAQWPQRANRLRDTLIPTIKGHVLEHRKALSTGLEQVENFRNAWVAWYKCNMIETSFSKADERCSYRNQWQAAQQRAICSASNKAPGSTGTKAEMRRGGGGAQCARASNPVLCYPGDIRGL